LVRKRTSVAQYIFYNSNWKNGSNLGKITNRKFNEIPYKRLIDKLKWKLNEKGCELATTEESYTSKCDSLAQEKICKHEKYLGKRTKRGLFSSSVKKLINADINADINGAINIGRKYYQKNGIEQKEIYNPKKIKII
jgi:putative transposase